MTPHHEILRPNIPPPRRSRVTPRISGHNSTGVLTPCPLLWGCVGCRQSADAGCARRAQDRGGGSRRIRARRCAGRRARPSQDIGMNIVETTGSSARAATRVVSTCNRVFHFLFECPWGPSPDADRGCACEMHSRDGSRATPQCSWRGNRCESTGKLVRKAGIRPGGVRARILKWGDGGAAGK